MTRKAKLLSAGAVDYSDAVYTGVRTRIIDGRLAPGEQITELGLAAEFGVSRTPAREAMRRLHHDGLLELTKRAMRVRVMGPDEVIDIYEVRIALEWAAARAAAERRNEFDLARLRHDLRAMRELEPSDEGSRSRLAHAFHSSLWLASHNATLIEALTRLQATVMGLASTTLSHRGRWEAVLVECSELFEAVERRNSDAAGEINRLQMTRSRDIRIEIYATALDGQSWQPRLVSDADADAATFRVGSSRPSASKAGAPSA